MWLCQSFLKLSGQYLYRQHVQADFIVQQSKLRSDFLIGKITQCQLHFLAEKILVCLLRCSSIHHMAHCNYSFRSSLGSFLNHIVSSKAYGIVQDIKYSASMSLNRCLCIFFLFCLIYFSYRIASASGSSWWVYWMKYEEMHMWKHCEYLEACLLISKLWRTLQCDSIATQEPDLWKTVKVPL